MTDELSGYVGGRVERNYTLMEDGEYADAMRQSIDLDRDALIAARKEGRTIAERDRKLDRAYNGDMAARAYRTLALPVDSQPATASILEQVFLVAYTNEYYRESQEPKELKGV